MKLYFKRLSVFCISFFVLLKLPGFFDINASNDQSRDLNSIACSLKNDSIDLLFLGSSYTYSSLNPIFFDSLGLKSYNLGISGTGVYFIELTLDDFYNSVEIKPKYVIIDISHFTFCDKSDDFLSYPLHRYLNKPFSHESLLLKYPDYLPNYLQLLAKSSKKGLSSFVSKNSYIDDSTCQNRGFYSDYTIRNQTIERQESIKLKFLKEAKFCEPKFRKLVELAATYQNRGCQIFWFEAPTQELKLFFNEAYRADYEIALAKLKQNPAFKEIPIEDIKLNLQDYRNTDHLNTYGANKISAAIRNKLRSHLKL